MKKILVLAPHTDDGEFGCGGTIARLTREGNEITYVAFSAAEESVPKHLPRDILRKEVIKATSELGIPSERCVVYNFSVRKFPEQRQDILEKMVAINKELKPEMVFLPSRFDTHQDHAVIAEEGFRAFKKTTILGYEVPWNNLDFRTSSFVLLEENDIVQKVNSLSCYVSQKHRDYASEGFIRSLASVRGVQIGERYAEAFELIRWIM